MQSSVKVQAMKMKGKFIHWLFVDLCIQEDYAGYDFENRLHVRIHSAFACMSSAQPWCLISTLNKMASWESDYKCELYCFTVFLLQCYEPKRLHGTWTNDSRRNLLGLQTCCCTAQHISTFKFYFLHCGWFKIEGCLVKKSTYLWDLRWICKMCPGITASNAK